MGAPTLSVIIPVFNEAGLVEQATRDLAQALDERKWDFEIVLAENGSKDETPAIVDRLAQEMPKVRCFHEAEPNYGRALRRGILEARGKYVVCDEIDLCDVDFYDRALNLLERGEAEMVVGSKAALGAKDERPFIRRSGTIVINGLLRMTLGFHGTDTHGLKMFLREALVPVAEKCVVERDLFASEFVIRASRMGKKLEEIPILVREKRPPTINLIRRVPNVLKNLARLVWVIRIKQE
jgi:glycosyltransferase involved in cell wall biosynthesis